MLVYKMITSTPFKSKRILLLLPYKSYMYNHLIEFIQMSGIKVNCLCYIAILETI